MFKGIKWVEFRYRTGITCQEEDKLFFESYIVLERHINFAVAITCNKRWMKMEE